MLKIKLKTHDGNNLQTIEELVRLRVSNSVEGPIWERDITTRNAVLYRPNTSPLLFDTTLLNDSELVYNYQKRELEVRCGLNGCVSRSKSITPIKKIIQPQELVNHPQFLGNDANLARTYAELLEHKGIDRIELFVLSGSYVDSVETPFIRLVRLKGIRSGNRNKGGLCADIRPFTYNSLN